MACLGAGMSRSVYSGRRLAAAVLCAPLLLSVVPASAQVFTIESEHVEKHYTEFPATNVKLPSEPMNAAGRERLIRFMQSEQGFAMRPLPVGTLILHANGSMEPSGDKYVNELHTKGVAAKPGDRLAITNVRIHDNTVIFDLNGGPYHKHRFLRHISISMDPYDDTDPLLADSAPPTGTRLIVAFQHRIPDISGQQMESLLKPMIDFGVRSQAAAYAESLPTFLRQAIEQHRVLIGMDSDMVRYAKGQPIQKIRESKDGQPFEIWVYGQAPQPVEFVRFVGNFVVRDDLARVGQPLEVRTANEMGNYWGTQPVVAANEHQIEMGDRSAADMQEENAPKAPPTLRNPGEKLPSDNDKNSRPAMAPVNFPRDQQRPGDPGYTPPAQTQPAGGSPQQQQQRPASGSVQKQSGNSGSQEQPNPLNSAPQPKGSGNGQSSGSPPTSQQ